MSDFNRLSLLFEAEVGKIHLPEKKRGSRLLALLLDAIEEEVSPEVASAMKTACSKWVQAKPSVQEGGRR